MKEFGYTPDQMAELTQEQLAFLMTGMEVDSRERANAQRRANLKKKMHR